MALELRHQTEQPLPPPPSPTTIEAVESSIQHLLSTWQKRQRLRRLLLLPFSCFFKRSQEDGSHDTYITKRAMWRTHPAEDLLDSLPIHLASMILVLLDLTLTVLDISSPLLSCRDPSRKEEQNRMYHWAGISILGLLSAKVFASALALGCSFFMSPGNVIDGIVMIGALVLEVVAEGKGAGLLVVASLWRVVRVVESACELGNEAIEAQIEGVVMQFELLSAENKRLDVVVAEDRERIEQLEGILATSQCRLSM